MELKLIHNGNPQGQARHRDRGYFITNKGGKVKAISRGKFDPMSDDKKLFRGAVRSQIPKGFIPLTCPMEIEVVFYMQRPKSHFRTGKFANELKKTAPHEHISKFDIDNCIKYLADALNGVIWKDDSIIWHVIASKIYDNKPRTELIIRWN